MKFIKQEAITALLIFAVILLVLYLSYEKINKPSIEGIRFSDNLNEKEINEVLTAIKPLVKKGYHLSNNLALSEKITQISWIAQANIYKSNSLYLLIDVIKDEPVFLFNQNGYINQFLKPKKMSERVQKQVDDLKLIHFFCEENQIEFGVNFYNKFAKNMDDSNTANLLEISNIHINKINQIYLDISAKLQNKSMRAKVLFGNENLEKRIYFFFQNTNQILEKIKKFGSEYPLIDLRYPKGFSVEK